MYEIYAYGNNDSLYGIFNAIAAIMGANSYLQATARHCQLAGGRVAMVA